MILNKLPYYLISVIFLFLFVIYGCDSNNANNDLICSIQEMQDRFANTQCIADELVSGCTNILCSGIDVSVLSFNENCIVVDCETLECQGIRIENTNPITIVSGLLTELSISELNGLPMGVFVINETETPFDCIFIAIN